MFVKLGDSAEVGKGERRSDVGGRRRAASRMGDGNGQAKVPYSGLSETL